MTDSSAARPETPYTSRKVVEHDPELEMRADAALELDGAPAPIMKNSPGARAPNGRFSKGMSGNLRGRPKSPEAKKKKKNREEESPEDIRHRVQNERVTVVWKGKKRQMTRYESLFRHTLARLNEAPPAQALRALQQPIKKEGPEFKGGVLVVPGMATNKSEWEKEAAASQARYRENPGTDEDDR